MAGDNTGSRITSIEREFHDHRIKNIFRRIFFIISGIVAASFPASAALDVEMIVRSILIMTGIFQLVLTVRS